jgi:prevent-host-death family protein
VCGGESYLRSYGCHVRKVGIKELKRDASAIAAAVEAGETVVITRRGAPVARMGPVAAPERVQRLADQRVLTCLLA